MHIILRQNVFETCARERPPRKQHRTDGPVNRDWTSGRRLPQICMYHYNLKPPPKPATPRGRAGADARGVSTTVVLKRQNREQEHLPQQSVNAPGTTTQHTYSSAYIAAEVAAVGRATAALGRQQIQSTLT